MLGNLSLSRVSGEEQSVWTAPPSVFRECFAHTPQASDTALLSLGCKAGA